MSYSHLTSHASMVFDETRNRAYLRAMREFITPDTVVLDVGAGIGVLGLLAAKAGARHVYCVEPSSVARHIKPLAEANGVGDRVTAIQAPIEAAELPEQVDVILSVFTGNLLFTEGLMPSLYFARDKYLKPGGVLIPDRARLLFAGVEASKRYSETAGRYCRESLDIDYSAVAANVVNDFYLMDRGKDSPLLITHSAIAIEIDLHTTHEDRVRWQAGLEVVRDGELHGLAGWIEIRLGEAWLSTGPNGADVHWHPILLPVASPMPVRQGQAVAATFQFMDDSHLVWSLEVDGKRQRQATLLGNPDAAIEVMLSSAGCSNAIGTEGEFVERALAAMREGQPNQAIADALYAAMPQHFRDARQALKRVGALSARYRAHPLRKP